MQPTIFILLILFFVRIDGGFTEEQRHNLKLPNQIQRLKLTGEFLEESYGNEILISVKYLKHFCGNVSDEKAEMIGSLIKKQKNLKSIGFVSCDLDVNFAKIFTKGIKESESIEELDLTNSEIGDFGSKAIATIIQGSKSLKIVKLYGVKIKWTNWCSIRDAIKMKGITTYVDVFRLDSSIWDFCNIS